jgi:PAS domain S-box-containing protein
MNQVKRTILLVGGNNKIQSLLREGLEAIGFQLLLCNSGAVALEKINSKQVDFICATHPLIDMEGLALYLQIQHKPIVFHKPFALLLDNNNDTAVFAKASALGLANIFLEREIEELLAVIKNFPYMEDKLSGSVLYLDSNDTQRESVSAMMSNMGLRVHAFATSDEAWPYFIENNVDVVVIDTMLAGELGGANIVNRIWRQPCSKGKTSILMLTPLDDKISRMTLTDLGISDYLITPVTEMDLFIRINRLLHKKELEIKLKEQQDLYRISFEQAAIGMAIVALDGRFLQANQLLLHFLGYSHKELLGLTFRDITHPAELQRSLEYMEQLIKGQMNSFSLEKSYFHKNGQVIWANVFVAIQRDATGAPLYFIGALQDITEKKVLQYKEALALEQYNNILDTTGDGFLLVSETGQIKDVNKAFIQMSGYSREELLTMSIPDLEAQETEAETREHIAKIMRQKYDLFETQQRTKSGRLLDLEVSVTYQESAGCFVSFLRNISERKKLRAQEKKALKVAEASLQRAIKAEKQLLQVYEETHQRLGQELHDDLGQQITTIALLAKILSEDLIKAESAFYEDAQKISTRLDQAVLWVRQLSHGLCPIDGEYNNLIEQLEALAQETACIHGICCTFHYDIDQVMPCFNTGDTSAEEFRIPLFRIAQEAVTNAVRHSQASQIQLLLHRRSKGDQLDIVDNGIGIATKKNSSGLGLYSMAFRAKLMNADITFKNLELGGTCVSICWGGGGEQKA